MSTRNQLTGTVLSTTQGEATAVVKIPLDGGHTLTSTITREAATELELGEGTIVTTLVKSSDAAIAIDRGASRSDSRRGRDAGAGARRSPWENAGAAQRRHMPGATRLPPTVVGETSTCR